MLWVPVAFSWNLHHFQSFSSLQSENGSILVPDSDLEIRGGGAVSKGIFSALPASAWSKNKGETQAPPLDPPLNFVCQGVNRRYIILLANVRENSDYRSPEVAVLNCSVIHL